jgi:LysR family positive regulator for ilvC
MNIRELNLFLHLSSTLHFGQSSRACNITRSGLTRTIQRLEQELGELLFLRDNRSVVLTRAGELFRDYAEHVMQRSNRLPIIQAFWHIAEQMSPGHITAGGADETHSYYQ